MIKRGDKYPWRYWVWFSFMSLLQLYVTIATFPGSTPDKTFGFHWPWWLFFLAFTWFVFWAYRSFTANKPLTDKTTLKP